jgi:outer membrane protein assembly factor BamB
VWVVAALALASATPQPLVLVPLPENEAECVLHERIAAVLDLVPEVRVLRAAKKPGEKLDATRVRLRADLALARENATIAAAGKSTKVQPIGIDSFAALAAVWPPNFPALPAAHALGAANPDALMAACRNEAAAYNLSGPAIGSVVRDRVDPPASLNTRVLERWAHARTQLKKGEAKKALPVLKAVVESLARGNIGPVWRRPVPQGGAIPSSLSLFGDLVVSFEAGTFVALDVTSGEERWRAAMGTSEPDLVEADKLLLAILENKIVALDPKNGTSVWSLELMGPHPEIVVKDGRIFAAGTEEMVAIDPMKGDVIWRFDPLDDIAAGPATVGADLVLPSATFVHVLSTGDGKEKRKIDVKDEISSPLAITPKGAIWALVGSDEVVHLDPEKGEVTRRVTRFPGADWPPAVGGERLVVAARRGKKQMIAYLDATVKAGVVKLFYGSHAPLLALPNDSGVVHPMESPFAIVARNLDGKPLWTAKQKASVASLSTSDGMIAGATGTRAIVLDRKQGQLVQLVELDGRITEVVLGPKGGAAVLERGAIYGLPAANDPRPVRWLEEARMDLARAHLQLKQTPAALALVRTVVNKNPNQLDALALRAEAMETQPPLAVVDWLELISRAPRGDAMVVRAQEALTKLAGVQERIALDDPIEDVAVAGDTVLLLVKGSATARTLADPNTVVWTKPAKAIGAALDGFEIDGGFFDRQGKQTGRRAADQKLVGDSLFAIETGKANAISRLEANAKQKWRQTFDGQVDVLAADARWVLVGDTAEGVQLLDANTGTRKWLLPLGAHATGAWIGEETVLVKMEKGYRSLALEDGRTRLNLPGTPGTAARTSSGYLVALGKVVMIADEKAKQKAVPMAAAVEHLAGSFVALQDGSLAALDLAKGGAVAKLRLGPFKEITLADKLLVALREDGTVLLIDAARSLKSRK